MRVRDSKFPQVSWSLWGVPAGICMVSILSLFSIPLIFFSSLWRTIPSAPARIGLIITLMLHAYLVFNMGHEFVNLFIFFHVHSVVSWNGKVLWTTSFFFSLLINTLSYLLSGTRCYVYISKSHRILFLSFFSQNLTELYSFHFFF